MDSDQILIVNLIVSGSFWLEFFCVLLVMGLDCWHQFINFQLNKPIKDSYWFHLLVSRDKIVTRLIVCYCIVFM